jgi:hypothetical protein
VRVSRVMKLAIEMFSSAPFAIEHAAVLARRLVSSPHADRSNRRQSFCRLAIDVPRVSMEARRPREVPVSSPAAVSCAPRSVTSLKR